jgi:hypothetical protein
LLATVRCKQIPPYYQLYNTVLPLYITVGVGLAPTQAVGNPNLFNQHSIPKTEEAIAFANSFLVGLFDQLLAGKGAHEQQQG